MSVIAEAHAWLNDNDYKTAEEAFDAAFAFANEVLLLAKQIDHLEGAAQAEFVGRIKAERTVAGAE